MDNPIVSAIMPIYNGARFLRAALESLFAQDYRPVEVIVVDDGSTDGSGEIARSFPGVICLSQANRGPAAARNTGVAAARGEILAFFDADDLWPPHKLSVQVGQLLAHPEVGYVVCLMENFIEPGCERPAWLPAAPDGDSFATGTLVVRADVFRRVGPFNPAYRVAEDVEWFIRAETAGVAKLIVPEILQYRRIHGRNLSGDAPEAASLVFRALKQAIDHRRAGK